VAQGIEVIQAGWDGSDCGCAWAAVSLAPQLERREVGQPPNSLRQGPIECGGLEGSPAPAGGATSSGRGPMPSQRRLVSPLNVPHTPGERGGWGGGGTGGGGGGAWLRAWGHGACQLQACDLLAPTGHRSQEVVGDIRLRET